MKKRNIIAAVLALSLCANISFSAENSSIDESLSYSNQASNKFMKKDIQGAISCLDEAIRISPNNPQLYLNRGFVKHVIYDYDNALADYNKALAINPKYAFAYNNRGVLKVSMNDIKGAMEDYETALNLNPKYADVYYNRGNLKYMIDDLNGALADYDKAIEYNPKDSEAYNNRGVVKKRLDYNVGALSDYSQAIAINPKDSIAYANRGRLKKLYFDNEGAAIDLNQAVALAENQAFIKNVKPLLSKQHYIAAIPAVASFAYDFTDTKPSNDNTINNEKLALNTTPAVQTLKKPEEKPLQKVQEPTNSVPKKEVKTVTKSAENKNSSKTPVLSAGVGKVAMPEVPDIRTSVVTNNATTNTKLAESYYIRGLQKCVLHDLQGAIVDLDKAIANNSKYADAYFYRAAIKKELGDTDGFRKDYSTAIQIKPSLQTYNDSDALSLI